MRRAALLAAAALLTAAGCGGRREVAARDTMTFDQTAVQARLNECLQDAARVTGDSAQNAAVSRCTALLPAGAVHVIGVIKEASPPRSTRPLPRALQNGFSTPRNSNPPESAAKTTPSPRGSISRPSGEVEIGRVRDGVVIRGRSTPPTVRPGTERELFLAAAASALEVNPARLKLETPIIAGYQADELAVYECVQRAEDIWRVQLLPPRIPVQEFSGLLAAFGTLGDIVAAAEAASRARPHRP